MDSVLDKAFTLNANVEVGKYTVLKLDTATTYTDGVLVPSGSNDGPIAGVAQESILPNGFNDYSGGQYQITSGTAWPANAIPSSATGRKISARVMGLTRVVTTAAAINKGDRLNIGDSQGRVKTINEGGGTTVFEVGWALDPSSAANSVIRCILTNIKRVL